MISSLNLGHNLYQGEISPDRQPNGKGTLLAEKRIQFITGIFQDGNLSDLHSAKLSEENNIIHNVKKFQGKYLYDCDGLGTVATLNFLNLKHITGNLSFTEIGEIFKDQMIVQEIFTEPIFIQLQSEFLKEFKTKCKRVKWKNEKNLALIFSSFVFYTQKELNLRDYLRDICFSELLAQFKLNMVLISIRNKIANQRQNIFLEKINSFICTFFKTKLILILQKTHKKYVEWLISNCESFTEETFKNLKYPVGFSIRKQDCDLYFDQIQKFDHPCHPPLTIEKLIENSNKNFKLIEKPVPLVASSYPDLFEFVFDRLHQLTASDSDVQSIFKRLNLNIMSDISDLSRDVNENNRIYITVLESQLRLGHQLLTYYEPGNPVKFRPVCGTTEDYSAWSVVLQLKNFSFISTSVRGGFPDELRIWIDLTDYGLSAAYVESQAELSSVELQKVRSLANSLIKIRFTNRYKSLEEEKTDECEISKKLMNEAILITNLLTILIQDKILLSEDFKIETLVRLLASDTFSDSLLYFVDSNRLSLVDLNEARMMLREFIDTNLDENLTSRASDVPRVLSVSQEVNIHIPPLTH